MMSEINRSRASLRTRGRYIAGKLEEAKNILRNSDSVQPKDYQETCEYIMVLIECIQNKEQAYAEVFEDLHQKVIPLCIGNEAEEDRHNTEYDQWIALKDDCENVIGDLKGVLSVLKFRMDLSKSQTSQISQTSLKRPVLAATAKPLDSFLARLDKEISKIDQELEDMSLTVPRGGVQEYLQEITPSHEHEGLIPEFNLLNIHSDDDYRKWLSPGASATQPVYCVAPGVSATQTVNSVVMPSVGLSTPRQVRFAEPLYTSTPISTVVSGATSGRDPRLRPTSAPFVPVTSTALGVSGTLGTSTLVMSTTPYTPDITPGIYTTNTTVVSSVPTPLVTHSTSMPAPVVPPTSWNPSASADMTAGASIPWDPLSFDLSRVIQRVRVPKFKGDKVNYENWKGAFISLVDKTNYSAEYKLMLLRDSLEGEPLKCIESLGFSKTAYTTAKQRLERKYGGIRRQLTLRLEDVDNFKPVRDNNEKDLQSFAELLDVLVVQLVETGNLAELYSVSMNLRVQAKLSKSLLAKYRQWLREYAKEENLNTLREFVNQQSEDLVQAGEVIKGITQKPKPSQSFVTQATSSTVSGGSNSTGRDGGASNGAASVKLCSLCSKQHAIWKCEKFAQMSVDERWKKAKELRLCFKCLVRGHQTDDCKNDKIKCGVPGCNKAHNRMLHPNKKTDRSKPQSQPQAETERTNVPRSQSSERQTPQNSSDTQAKQVHGTCALTTMSSDGELDEVSLRTVPVYVANGERIMKIHAMLDDCSTTTYVNEDVTAELQLQCDAEDISVGVLNGSRTECSSGQVGFEIRSLDGKIRKNISAYLMDNVTGDLQVRDWNKLKSQYSHLKDIPFPKIDKTKRKIDMLIGADNCDLIYSLQEVIGEPGEPVARLTPLGWTCIGPTQNSSKRTHFSFLTVQSPEETEVVQTLKKCWQIEEPENHPQKTINATVLENAKKSIAYNDSTYRYSVGIPWKTPRKRVPNTMPMAIKRLENTEKRLDKDPDLRQQYGGILISYEEKGYIRRVPATEPEPEQSFHLGHFPVIKPQRLTTKVRICFDSAQKCEGISLNDLIHPGPKLQNDINEVLVHMRKHLIVLMADVSEMYYQIELKPEDRPFFRFLWRESADQPIIVYEFQRVFFGLNAAPFLAHFVSQHHARLNIDSLPLAARTVLKYTYMDDNLDSIPTVNQGIMLYKQLCTFWATCGMRPHKWVSNSRELLKEIPSADIIPTFDLDKDEMPSTKTLGSVWKPKEDQFTFETKELDVTLSVTKRNYLHNIASLWDPLGLIAPYTILAKILFQEMWSRGYTWDEEISSELRQRVTNWYLELTVASEISFIRCLRSNEAVISTQLHMFCDASTEAYGACVYTRHSYSDGHVTCRLTEAKGKVCPLRAVSIPRLELMSAGVGLKLMLKVAAALEVPPAEWFMWSDSMDVLHWVRGRSREYKPFVSHRVGEIQHYTEPEQWRHVPSNLNPSDVISRGRTLTQLKYEEKWWSGAPYLLLSEDQWPETDLSTTHQVKELRRKAETFSSVIQPMKKFDRLDPKNYSSLTRMHRVNAWVNRFVTNAQIPDEKDRITGSLGPDEITAAETKVLITCQHSAFNEEIDKLKKDKPVTGKLAMLNPFIDDEGLLRSNGRLAYAESLPWETRYPIILPTNDSLTELIIKDAHEQMQHGGTNHVLHFLSAKYWILSGREEIRKWENKCNMCKRRKRSPATQIMAPLPKCRSAKSLKSFTLVSLDFAGPIKTKQGRGKVRLERYICLFTDLEIRAVHLEVAYALTTDSFLMSLSRMTDRRGVMTDIWCDNGTNFLGAKNELEALEKQNEVIDKTAHRKITWHFQPPAGPHHSGVHERMVQSAKRAVYAILNSAEISDEELHTAVSAAEALINSRPLTYQSANVDDIAPLTPNHFLTGQMGGNFAPTEVVDTTDFNPKKRWRRIQELTRHFWQRWMIEWLPSLQGRRKWMDNQENLKVGDIVLVVSPDTPRGSWPLGRVTQTFPGKDDKVRVVEVKVKDKLLRRPITKLCPIT